MTRADDSSSPPASFSGDETGEIFNAPDMVLESPTTSQRAVETQSGFLIIVRTLAEMRRSLSVKRQLGTPPASSVLLTADESLALSRILSGGFLPGQKTDLRADRLRTDKWEAAGKYLSKQTHFTAIRRVLPVVLIALLASVVLSWLLKPPPAQIVVKEQPANPLTPANIELFLRRFVNNMLDFNPKTYKISQIRAMAAMSPDLLDTYWHDTDFPVAASQSRERPYDTKVLIEKVISHTPGSGVNTVNAEVYGQLLDGEDRKAKASPFHLSLTLALEPDGKLYVRRLKDISAGSK